jgi:hypothetical protein
VTRILLIFSDIKVSIFSICLIDIHDRNMLTNKVGWQGKTPPIELRQQVVAARLAGKTPREVTEITGLSAQTQARYP